MVKGRIATHPGTGVGWTGGNTSPGNKIAKKDKWNDVSGRDRQACSGNGDGSGKPEAEGKERLRRDEQ